MKSRLRSVAGAYWQSLLIFLTDIAGNELQSIAVPAHQLLDLCRKISPAIHADNSGCIALKIAADYGKTDA